MNNIFARSPFMVTINELGQIETKLEIYLWNGTGPAPTNPTKVLSKKIAASNYTSTSYDVSPYILEYINHETLQTVVGLTTLPTNQYVNVKIKKFKKITTSFIQVGSDLTYLGFDGFGYFEDGSNPNLGDYHMIQDTYNYDPFGNSIGFLTFYATAGYTVRYTNLVTGAVTTTTATSSVMANVPLVRSGWESQGNKFEVLNVSMLPKFTATMIPIEECKYTPVECNFVNQFGAWQSTFFFKVSKRTMSKTKSQYKLNPSTWPTYNQQTAQVREFNTNGTLSITVNTGWVKESYSEVIKQLMLSERILIDGQAFILNTDSIELYESINNKNINYELQFNAAFDMINSVN